MSDPDETITITTRRDGDTVVVTVVGELDMHSAAVLASALTTALDGSPREIDIDGRGLSFADSAGLRSLLMARDEAEARGVLLRLTHVSDPLDRLLEMTGLREILGVPTT
jgi:anti-anti-sigma factor